MFTMISAWAGTWRDDFEHDELDDWKPDTLGRGERVEWKIEQGMLSGRNIDKIPDNWATCLVTGHMEWADYDLRVKVRFSKRQAGWAGLGIALRSQENVITGFYSLAFLLDRDQVAAYKRVGFNITSFTIRPIDAVPDKWYLLQITADGKHIQFYVNGELLTDANDTTFASGKICLWLANVHAYFDDVIVSGPNIPDGGHWDISKHGETVGPLDKLAMIWGRLKR
jgi:hypothetical protein